MIRFNPLLSITAKLFIFTTLLVLITAGVLAMRNSETFKKQFDEQTRRFLLDSSEKVGSSLEKSLDSWDGGLKVAIASTLALPEEKRSAYLNDYLRAEPAFIGLQIYHSVTPTDYKSIAGAYTKENSSMHSKALKIDDITAKLTPMVLQKLIKERSHNSNKHVLVFSLYAELKLPVMVIAHGLNETSTNTSYWGVLTIFQDSILESLATPDQDQFRTTVIDDQGRAIASAERIDLSGKSDFKKLPLWSMAMKNPNRSSYRGSYQFGGATWNGAYFRIANFNLTVVSQQRAELVEKARTKLITESLLLALFITLIATLFSYFGATGLTSNLKSVIATTQRISKGDFSHRVKVSSRDEIGVLSNSINHMGIQIVHLLKKQIQQARMEKELETANSVQDTIFPPSAIKSGPLVISGFNKSASECGGDWWGTCSTTTGIEYVFIADAMGHGVPAALVTAMAYASCTTLGSMIQDKYRELGSPAIILNKFNDVLYNAVKGRISMSFFALMIDHNRGTLTYANAGHNFPYVIPLDPYDNRIKKKSKIKDHPAPIALIANGNLLGVNKNETYIEKTFEIRPGDKIFLFTDGLTECKSPKGEVWGTRILCDKLAGYYQKNAEDLLGAITTDAYKFYHNIPQADDITIVVVELDKDHKFTLEKQPKQSMPA